MSKHDDDVEYVTMLAVSQNLFARRTVFYYVEKMIFSRVTQAINKLEHFLTHYDYIVMSLVVVGWAFLMADILQ